MRSITSSSRVRRGARASLSALIATSGEWFSAFENAAAENRQQKVRIHSGKNKPAGAFAAVHYRDHWFWVDDGDWQTKRAMSAIMFFFTLAETGSSDKLPLITIPAQ